ncbi:MFS transporter [Tomitella gaofuii]|uniref:MFS transporter n=1 Tax=Tomitella gaofuii TaxID=2760083 RepID=UPI0015F89C69|nr:MFS transporter [Tomitella gaofuii]
MRRRAVRGAARTPIPRSIWVLVSAAFVIALGFGLVAPVLPQFAKSFDVGTTAATVIISAFAFFRLVFAPAGGRLVNLVGERWVYLTGLFIVAVSTGACAFAADYWQLLVFRGLGGIGSTMFTVSAMGLLVRLADPGARGRVTGLYSSAFLVGNILGPVLGGLLAGFGLRVPFLVYAAALIVAMLVVGLLLKDVHPADGGDGPDKPAMELREALAHRAYRAALVSKFANGWSSMGVRVALVPLFAVAIGAGESMAGVALAVFAVGNALVIIPAGRIADTRGRKPMVLAGLVVTGVGTAALGLSAGSAMLVVTSFVAGAGAGLLNAPQQAAVADLIGADRRGGSVLAGFQMLSDVGAIIGPIAAGFLAEQASYSVAFAVTGAVCLLAAIPWAGAPETLKGARRGGPDVVVRGEDTEPGRS